MPWDDDLLNKPEAEAGYEVGEVLPAWQKGYLDIHAINSGRGECVFYILPDGTTMVVDAGEVMAAGDSYIQRKPDQGTRPYVTYARYIKHFLPEGKKINPLIGNAGVSAVPMAARISNQEGLKADPHNYLLMHAMGPNVAGVIGSAVAAGVLLGFLL